MAVSVLGSSSRGRPFDAEHQHEGFGRGRPLGGVFVQAAFRDFAQGAAELPEVRFVVDDSLDYGFQGAVAERAAPVGRVDEGGTPGEHVDGRSERPTGDLLRGHVGGGPAILLVRIAFSFRGPGRCRSR